ncbi:MAG: polysaccharide pyruvyl transferase family protein [Cyanobacteria bacterium]|nr:polysaccharide pyruvyl transferase family protein [Cyanobacteriota bacterium]MDW8202195.1 polysaccharide pyruvyl transferase family protein [Cyanobacteriota bacterium SKYGB_h_bin112]
MKIIIGNIVTLNTGDAAILIATIEMLKATFGQDLEVVVYDRQPDAAAKLYPDIVFRRWPYLSFGHYLNPTVTRKRLRWWHGLRLWLGEMLLRYKLAVLAQILLTAEEQTLLEDHQSADLAISGGGTYLVENYDMTPRIFDYNLVLRWGCPLAFFTQSLGPFTKPIIRAALKPIFNQAIAILVRGQASQDHLLDLGIDPSLIHIMADAAFALGDLATIRAAAQAPAQPLQRVAISVRDWSHFKTMDAETGMKRYIAAFQALTTYLVTHHRVQVTYLSTCQGIPDYWLDDSAVAVQIVSGLADVVRSAVTVDRKFRPPRKLMAALQSFDLVIPTRMHMAILSLSMGVPVFPIAYEFKTQELFTKLGQQNWVQDIETLEAETLIRQVDAYWAALPDQRAALFAGVEQEYHRAWEAAHVLRQAYDRYRARSSPQLHRSQPSTTHA